MEALWCYASSSKSRRASQLENLLLCLMIGLFRCALRLRGIVHSWNFWLGDCLFHLWEIGLRGLRWHDPVVVDSVKVNEDWWLLAKLGLSQNQPERQLDQFQSVFVRDGVRRCLKLDDDNWALELVCSPYNHLVVGGTLHVSTRAFLI